MERRLAVGVLVILIVVLNAWLIWPHFSDWGNLRDRLDGARQKLKLYQTTIAQMTNYAAQVKSLEGQGEFVAPEDQAINFMRTIQSQSAASGISGVNYSRSTMLTNEFFVEQFQNIGLTATDGQLVDFLYKLGSGSSMVRVLDLELQPDNARQHLNANIRLVANYQKKQAPPPAAPADSKLLTKTAK
jgi:Tfp pilus assembly protein PilO